MKSPILSRHAAPPRRPFGLAVGMLALTLPAVAATRAPPAAATAAVPTAPVPEAFEGAALQRGMRYADFHAHAGASGWAPENAQRAGSCAAAGDCEIVFGRPQGADQLHVHIGSVEGVAVIDRWRFTPRRIDSDTDAAGLTVDSGVRGGGGDDGAAEPRR